MKENTIKKRNNHVLGVDLHSLIFFRQIYECLIYQFRPPYGYMHFQLTEMMRYLKQNRYIFIIQLFNDHVKGEIDHFH